MRKCCKSLQKRSRAPTCIQSYARTGRRWCYRIGCSSGTGPSSGFLTVPWVRWKGPLSAQDWTTVSVPITGVYFIVVQTLIKIIKPLLERPTALGFSSDPQNQCFLLLSSSHSLCCRSVLEERYRPALIYSHQSAANILSVLQREFRSRNALVLEE